MQSPTDGSDSYGLAPDGVPNWEAFYSDYRKPGFVEGFEITTKLGGGMFGLVFRARRMSIGKDYAIKFLKVDDGEVRRAVLSELEQVKYFAQIDHPNLVSIEDRGEVHGIPFLVMAFAGTETLRDHMTASSIGDGKPPTAAQKQELVRAFLQSCRGLQALHDRSLVHFDIKPANVFMKGGVARLGDYGLSKLVTHSRGSLSMGRGTPYYMAPEMLQRRGDARSDIYSLGVMLYEILCGKVPFTGDSEWEVLRKHENTAPVLPSHLTQVERTVLQGCLAKDPDARFQSVAQLLAAFGPVSPISDLPVRSGPIGSVAAGGGLGRGDAAARNAVPPPLPATGKAPVVGPPPPPPTTSRRQRRRARRQQGSSARRVGLIVALLLVVGFFGLSMQVSAPRSYGPVAVYPAESEATSVVMTQPSSLKAVAQQRADAALANGRRAAQRNRPQKLRGINFDLVSVPDDFEAHGAMLKPLVESPRFVPALATRIKQLGRPAMVAAVALLQELDYRDGRACQQAENLQRLLTEMTGVHRLVVEVAGLEPSPMERCMLHAVADGWREITELCAANDQVYSDLLAGRRSFQVRSTGISPR